MSSDGRVTHIGGQLTEIYPKKPIYDIPGFPQVLAGELIQNIKKQIEPFRPGFTLGERADTIEQLEDGRFRVTGSGGGLIETKVIVIAGGLGCFEPRKPPINGIDRYEGKGVDYFVKLPETYHNKKVIIAGGGDSALDWTIELAPVTESLSLIHRSSSFRGAPESADRMFKFVNEGKVDLYTNAQVVELLGEDKLEAVVIEYDWKTESKLKLIL